MRRRAARETRRRGPEGHARLHDAAVADLDRDVDLALDVAHEVALARLGPVFADRVQLARDELVPLQVVRLEDGGEAARADQIEQHEPARVGPVAERARLNDSIEDPFA